MRNAKLNTVVALVVGSLLGTSAFAGTIHAHYELAYDTQKVKLYTNLPGHTGALEPSAAILAGDRLDLPAGPGVDTNVPDLFNTACVEIGENINVPSNSTHPNVYPLLGATTTLGGYSGPVYFDAARTKATEKLWGAFFGSVVNKTTAAIFQLCQWEIAFDTDLTLNDPTQLTPFFVKPGQFQAGITDVAEGWLATIRNDTNDQLPRTSMLLLSGPGIQDLVTPLPEPASLALLLAGLLIRRK